MINLPLKVLRGNNYIIMRKNTHFASIRRNADHENVRDIFTTIPLTVEIADEIGRLYPEITVERINKDKGFLFVKLDKTTEASAIEDAVESVIFKGL